MVGNIHSTAVISDKAELGRDVSVGPLAFVDAHVRVGDGTQIGPQAAVLAHTALGPGCRVHAHAVLGDLPQDLAFAGGESFLRIGARCVIREGVTVHRGTEPGTATQVGDECYLMANCHLAHNVRLGDGVVVANGALLGGYVEVGARAFISGNCLLHQFVRVGRLAMLGGGSALGKDVPPFCTTVSLSGNQVAGLNVVGLRRAGFAPAERAEIKRAFSLLYNSGLNVSQALAAIRKDLQSGAVMELAAFVEQSRRGICRLSSKLADRDS